MELTTFEGTELRWIFVLLDGATDWPVLHGLLKPFRGYGEIVHICYNLSIFNLFSSEIDGMKMIRISSLVTLRQIEEPT